MSKMEGKNKNTVAYISICIAIVSLIISAVNIYELHYSGAKIKIESFESYKEDVSFIVYNGGREPAFIKEITIQELKPDKTPIPIHARQEYKRGEYPFPQVSPCGNLIIESKSSVKVKGKIPFPGATITKDYRLVIYNSNDTKLAERYFQVSW